jgi:hypothetical protein
MFHIVITKHKRRRRSKMKKLLLVGVIAGGLILGGCSEEIKKETEPKVETVENDKETVKEVPKEVKEPEVKEEPKISPEVYLELMKENFGDSMEITYDSEQKAFIMNPVDPAFTQELLMIINGTKSIDDWNFLVDSMAEMSKELGADYIVIMANPANPENYILMVGNGLVMYDALNE